MRPSPAVEAELHTAGRVHFMSLPELTGEQSLEMLVSLLGGGAVPEQLPPVLLERTEGNPFYLEELVNHLDRVRNPGEAGGLVGTGAAPGAGGLTHNGSGGHPGNSRRPRAGGAGFCSVPRSLAAGSSRRPWRRRRRTESLRPSLNELQEHDLIRQLETQLNAEYSLKHAMTQDVGYQGVLPSERKAVHERVGRAIECLFPAEIGDLVENLASTFGRRID